MPRKGYQSEETRRAIQQDEELTQRLVEDGKQRRDQIKILLLGPSGCGKSTFIKQALLASNQADFSEEYRKSMRSAIFTSMVELMHKIIGRLDECDAFRDDGPLKPHVLAGLAATTPYEQEMLDPELSRYLEHLWKEDLISEKGYELVENERLVIEYAAKHYLNDLSRISSKDYVPSPEDILKLHSPTQGVEETVFQVGRNGWKLSFFEVGHMISDQRKWLPYTDNVDAIAYMVPYSMYDCGEPIDEDDPRRNPFQEALSDFGAIVESQQEWLRRESILLFFNGADKAKEKLSSRPFRDFFPEFNSEDTMLERAKFLLSLFQDRMKDENMRQLVSPHFLSSLDQSIVRFIMSMIIDMLMPPICQPRPFYC